MSLNKKISKPKKLYKYESFGAQALQNLKAQSIYFGPPSGFNDPYDCALYPRIKPLTDADVQKVRDSYLKEVNLPDQVRDQIISQSIDESRELFVRSGETALHRRRQEFLDSRGVSCFSEINDDLLMWSHYGGRYRGYCLEFDTSAELFEKALPITYESEIPTIDLTPLLTSDSFDQVMDMFTTKSISWKYEREWRVIHAAVGTLYSYPSSCLTHIYFGPEMSIQSIEIICLVLQGQNSSVKFSRGKRSESEFKVEFEPFTYTSHLKAKESQSR